MWKILGAYYILVAPNMFQVVEIKFFEKPQDCFAEAMKVMKDENDPRNMACIPTFHKGKDT